MLFTVLLLFLLTALGGLTAFIKHVKGKNVSPVFGYAHGGIGLMGLLFLGITVFTITVDPLVEAAFWLFLLVAAGGVIQAILRIRGVMPPRALFVAHGTGALIAIVLLLIGAYR